MPRTAERRFRRPNNSGTVRKYVGSPLLAIALLATFAWESAAQGRDGGPDHAADRQTAERIHYGDVVDVDFIGSFEFDWRGKITPEGFLDGLERSESPVFALCRTEAEVAADIADKHKYFLRDPKVAVRIVDRTDRALAYVSGAVKKPKRFRFRRPVSLLELIVISGGITDSSDGEILVFRPPDASCASQSGPDGSERRPQQLKIKISDLLSGRPEANPKIVMGDIITVVEAPPVFVIGDVAAPRRMNLTPELTLSRAVASAGGVNRSFSGQKARIHRRNAQTGPMEFDLRRVIDKQDEDPKLQAYDVIEVEHRGFEPKRIAPVPDPQPLSADTISKLPLRIVD